MTAHPTTFAFVQIHHGDDYATTWGNNRAIFYTDFSGYPTVYFDGAITAVGEVPYSTYQADWTTRHNISTDVTIEVRGTQVSGATWDVTAHVCLEAGGAAKTMRIYIVQVLDHWPTVVTYSRNGFKQAGTTQDVYVTAGQCTDVTRRFTFDSTSWADPNNIAIVAWAQEPQNTSPTTDRAYVYQAAQQRFRDCNSNGILDPGDIASGYSQDCNSNGIPDECEVGGTTDCNSNGIHDLCDIYNGTSLDCNSNGVPDSCDVASGTSQDCNSNGIPDSCDIASGHSGDCNHNGVPDECDPDCNHNGIPDACDIANHTSLDCNSNGIPDECDLASGTSHDCNSNGIPDECDIANHTVPDCNANGVPDACDLANCDGSPWCSDCNSNGIPDVCDLSTAFGATSPTYTPLGYPTAHTFTLTAPPDATSNVLLTFSALGDLFSASKYVNVTINSQSVGTAYGHTGYFSCSPNQIDTLTVPMATYNTLKASGGGNVAIAMLPTSNMNPTACGSTPTTIQVTVAYPALSNAQDLNSNGIPDECEPGACCLPGAQCELKKPALCTQAGGTYEGLGTTCTPSPCGPVVCHGDTNCDGRVTFADIDPFVEALAGESAWNANHPGCPWLNADCNGDLNVTFADIDPFVATIGTTCPP
jgi:hypothetical protein